MGVDPGDVIRAVAVDGQTYHVLVPDGATPGSSLVLEGAIEVRVPLGATPDEVIDVQLPDESLVSVRLTDADTPGSPLNIGFPITIFVAL